MADTPHTHIITHELTTNYNEGTYIPGSIWLQEKMADSQTTFRGMLLTIVLEGDPCLCSTPPHLPDCGNEGHWREWGERRWEEQSEAWQKRHALMLVGPWCMRRVTWEGYNMR